MAKIPIKNLLNSVNILKNAGFSMNRIKTVYNSGNLDKLANLVNQRKNNAIRINNIPKENMLNEYMFNNYKNVFHGEVKGLSVSQIEDLRKQIISGYKATPNKVDKLNSAAIKNGINLKNSLENIDYEVAQGNFLRAQENATSRISATKRSNVRKEQKAFEDRQKLEEYKRNLPGQTKASYNAQAVDETVSRDNNVLTNKEIRAFSDSKENAFYNLLEKRKILNENRKARKNNAVKEYSEKVNVTHKPKFVRTPEEVSAMNSSSVRSQNEINKVFKEQEQNSFFNKVKNFFSSDKKSGSWYDNAESYHDEILRKKEDLVKKKLYSQEELDKYRNAGITTMDYIMGNKIPQTGAGVLGTFWIVNALAANRGQQTNAQLYGQDRSYMPY